MGFMKRLGASVMIDQNLVLSNENGASNWVEDHTNVKPLQNHVKIHHFILGNKLNFMIQGDSVDKKAGFS